LIDALPEYFPVTKEFHGHLRLELNQDLSKAWFLKGKEQTEKLANIWLKMKKFNLIPILVK
jgi:ribosomal protein S16